MYKINLKGAGAMERGLGISESTAVLLSVRDLAWKHLPCTHDHEKQRKKHHEGEQSCSHRR